MRLKKPQYEKIKELCFYIRLVVKDDKQLIQLGKEVDRILDDVDKVRVEDNARFYAKLKEKREKEKEQRFKNVTPKYAWMDNLEDGDKDV